jgi:hypothetical protein
LTGVKRTIPNVTELMGLAGLQRRYAAIVESFLRCAFIDVDELERVAGLSLTAEIRDRSLDMVLIHLSAGHDAFNDGRRDGRVCAAARACVGGQRELSHKKQTGANDTDDH